MSVKLTTGIHRGVALFGIKQITRYVKYKINGVKIEDTYCKKRRYMLSKNKIEDAYCKKTTYKAVKRHVIYTVKRQDAFCKETRYIL